MICVLHAINRKVHFSLLHFLAVCRVVVVNISDSCVFSVTSTQYSVLSHHNDVHGSLTLLWHNGVRFIILSGPLKQSTNVITAARTRPESRCIVLTHSTTRHVALIPTSFPLRLNAHIATHVTSTSTDIFNSQQRACGIAPHEARSFPPHATPPALCMRYYWKVVGARLMCPVSKFDAGGAIQVIES